MLSAQTNYHLANKDIATVEFVSNMLQNEANNYLSNMNTLSHVSKMCSSLTAHWPPVGINMPNPGHHINHHLNQHNHQIAHLTQSSNQLAQNAAAVAAAASLAAGHNIESILGGGYSVKIDNDKMNKNDSNMFNNNMISKHDSNLKNPEFNNSYDAGKF